MYHCVLQRHQEAWRYRPKAKRCQLPFAAEQEWVAGTQSRLGHFEQEELLALRKPNHDSSSHQVLMD